MQQSMLCNVVSSMRFFFEHRIGILLLALAPVFMNCRVSPPERVQDIPERAFWVGGKDGGQWYVVDSINKSDQTIRCKIYTDNSGELIVDKKFKLHCPSEENNIKWENLEEEFNSYDGEYLMLTSHDREGKYCYFK